MENLSLALGVFISALALALAIVWIILPILLLIKLTRIQGALDRIQYSTYKLEQAAEHLSKQTQP